VWPTGPTSLDGTDGWPSYTKIGLYWNVFLLILPSLVTWACSLEQAKSMAIPYMPMLIPPISVWHMVCICYLFYLLIVIWCIYKLDNTYGLELWLFLWYYYIHNVIDRSNRKDSHLYINLASDLFMLIDFVWSDSTWLVAWTTDHFSAFPCMQLKVLDLAYLASTHPGPSIRKQASNQVLLDNQRTYTAWLSSNRHPIT
jgi:hypothetical protein